MGIRYGSLVVMLFVGGWAMPRPENDMSIFFEHTNCDTRIVGGTLVAPGSHPHMVALSSGLLVRSFFCGGSLITTRTVLTAAHCIGHVYSFGSLSRSLRATVGTNHWNFGGTSYSLSRNVTHQHYHLGTITNDIGILITTSEVVLSSLVNVVPISYDFVAAGVISKVAGWGKIWHEGPLSTSLLELTMTTIEGNDCVRYVAQAAIDFKVWAPPVDPNIEVCTLHSPNHGICNGDSGSALVRVDSNEQFGIVSWGFPCARGAPDMFVRISAYQEWLQQHII